MRLGSNNLIVAVGPGFEESQLAYSCNILLLDTVPSYFESFFEIQVLMLENLSHPYFNCLVGVKLILNGSVF